MEKRFYKSRTDKKLAGVCAGIAEYFEVDPTLVRLIWVVFTFAGGAGVIAYIIAAIVMPEAPEYQDRDRHQPNSPHKGYNDTRSEYTEEEAVIIEVEDDNGDTADSSTEHRGYDRESAENREGKYQPVKEKKEDRNNFVIGAVLILIGAMFFSRNFFRWFWIDFSYIWPIILILIGVALIVNRRK